MKPDEEIAPANRSVQAVITINETEAVTLIGLKLDPPDKTTYQQGEALDISGMSVTAVYSDGSVKTLEEGMYMVENFSSDEPGKIAVTVSYTEGETK